MRRPCASSSPNVRPCCRGALQRVPVILRPRFSRPKDLNRATPGFPTWAAPDSPVPITVMQIKFSRGSPRRNSGRAPQKQKGRIASAAIRPTYPDAMPHALVVPARSLYFGYQAAGRVCLWHLCPIPPDLRRPSQGRSQSLDLGQQTRPLWGIPQC